MGNAVYFVTYWTTDSDLPPELVNLARRNEALVAAAEQPYWVGCFEDRSERDFEMGPYARGYSTTTCAQACQRYRYMALQDGGFCMCSDRPPAYARVPDENCGRVCAGEERLGPSATVAVVGVMQCIS